MRPYHPNTIKMTGHPYWRLAALAWAGELLGIQFHVQGLPFGAEYRGPRGESPFSQMAMGSSAGLGKDPIQAIVTHPDGKVFYRNASDQWMPLEGFGG